MGGQTQNRCQRQRKPQESRKITMPSQDYRMLFTPTLSADRDLVIAPDYAAWSKAAREHDRKSGLQAWRDADESRYFDHKAIRGRLAKLSKLSAAGDVKGLLLDRQSTRLNSSH